MATAKKVVRRLKLRRGIRNKISGSSNMPRLAVFKSNKAIYAQLIDDVAGATIASVTSLGSELKGTKTEVAKGVGGMIADAAKAKGVDSVVFDRGGYVYHGRVKALADGAREAGLKF